MSERRSPEEPIPDQRVPARKRSPLAKDDLRAKARELRGQGRTYDEIAAELGVSKSSCSLWLRDMPRPDRSRLGPAGRRAAGTGRERRREGMERREASRLATKLQAAGQIGALGGRDLLLAGAVLYWCEGAKSKPGRRVDRIDFCNSDPALIALFLRFLDSVGVPRDRLGFRIQIHDSADLERAMAFWLECTAAPASLFRCPSIKLAKAATDRKNVGRGYHGCLRVTVSQSADLYHRIEGLARAVLSHGGRDARSPGGPVEGRQPVLPALAGLRARAGRLRESGMSRGEIGDRLGIPNGHLVDELVKGVPPSAEWLERSTPLELLEDRARELGAMGWGQRRIADHLGIGRELVRGWLRDSARFAEILTRERRPRVAGQRLYWEGERAKSRLIREEVAVAAASEVGQLDGREIRLLGAIAYWCEGSKDKPYQRREQISFVNSDPCVISFLMAFLRALSVDTARLGLRVQIHRSADVEAATAFWADVTGVRAESFRPPNIKIHRPKTRREDANGTYHGCLRIDVRRSAELYRKIEGWALGAMLGESGARERWS